MPAKIFLKPADPKVKVRKPTPAHAGDTHLAADGEAVVLDAYWRRRLAAGEVVEAKPPRKAPSAAVKEQ